MVVEKIYRVSNWLFRRKIPLLPWLLKSINRIFFSVVIPPSAAIGTGVKFSYEGLGTIIHWRAVIENDVVIGAGVTIGGRSNIFEVPKICEGTYIGNGAKILGNVRVGRFAIIGANAVVLTDVPDFGVAVGIPAKVIKIRGALSDGGQVD